MIYKDFLAFYIQNLPENCSEIARLFQFFAFLCRAGVNGKQDATRARQPMCPKALKKEGREKQDSSHKFNSMKTVPKMT